MTDINDHHHKQLAEYVAIRCREGALALVEARAGGVYDMAKVADELWNQIDEDERVGFERDNFQRMFDILLSGLVGAFGAVPDGMTRFEFFRGAVSDLWIRLLGTTQPSTVSSRIDRELLEAAKKTRAGDSPAVQGAVVLIGGVTIQGSLSRADDGLLRMLTPTGTPPSPMVEQFFSDDDVVAFVVIREVSVESPRIIHA